MADESDSELTLLEREAYPVRSVQVLEVCTPSLYRRSMARYLQINQNNGRFLRYTRLPANAQSSGILSSKQIAVRSNQLHPAIGPF